MFVHNSLTTFVQTNNRKVLQLEKFSFDCSFEEPITIFKKADGAYHKKLSNNKLNDNLNQFFLTEKRWTNVNRQLTKKLKPS